MQRVPGAIALVVRCQGLGFDQVQLNGVVGLCVACQGQFFRCFATATMTDQDVRLAQLCGQVFVARADQRVLGQCALGIIAFFGDAAQVQMRRVDMAVALDQLLQITFGFVPGLAFQADQCQRESQLIVFGVLLHQAGKLHFCLGHAVLLDQGARIGQAQAFVVGVLADAFFQQRQRFVAAVEALQQACAQQNRSDLTVLRRVFLQQFQRALGITVLLHQQGLAENQLAVVRVPDQQAVKALLQACAGLGIGFYGRQGQEIEVRVTLGLQDFLHVHQGLVIAAVTRQLNGCSTLCLDILRGVLDPDQRGVQCRLVGAQVLGDTKRPLGDTRVLGIDRLRHIVIEGDIQAIALAGQLGAQQAVQRFFAERAVDRGFFRGGGNVFSRG